MLYETSTCLWRFAARIAVFGGSLSFAVSGQAHASLVISGGATTNVSCASGVCTATAADAVLNAASLQSMLGSSNVDVKTGTAATDIVVVSSLTWVAANDLTLDAKHSIEVDRPVSDAGTGGLTLVTDDGGTGGRLGFGARGNITFMGTSNALTIDGVAYTLVNSIAALAHAVATAPAGNFALPRSYNAATDGTYGNAPVATTFGTPFTGIFEGLGNTISNLSVAAKSSSYKYVGLFAVVAGAGGVNDLRLTKVVVRGSDFAGGIAGFAYGSSVFSGDIVDGRIKSTEINGYAGGLAGSAVGIVDSVAHVTVSGGDDATVGGLAGSGGAVSNSQASGRVSGGQYSYVGGLLGYARSNVANSSSSAAVTGSIGSIAGGLFASGQSQVARSSASGSVHGDAQAGGLVGEWNISGSISESCATAAVSGGAVAGGLVGNNSNGTVSRSFATGSVTGGGQVGGLAGINGNMASIDNSYSTGAVSGGSAAGGFVGSNSGAISNSYSTGVVTAAPSADIGGFAGGDVTLGGIANAYWDTDASGVSASSQGAGNYANDPGITGDTTAKLRSGLPAGFGSKIWSESPTVNSGLPYLRGVTPAAAQVR